MKAKSIDLMGFGGGPGCASGINYRGEIILYDDIHDGMILCTAGDECERKLTFGDKWEQIPKGTQFLIGCSTVREIRLI